MNSRKTAPAEDLSKSLNCFVNTLFCKIMNNKFEAFFQEIEAASKLNSWGGKLKGDFQEIFNLLENLKELGIAKNYGFSGYRIPINDRYYVVRDNDGNWTVDAKTKKVKLESKDELSQKVVELCYECGYNVAVINGKCVSCVD